MTSDAQQLDRLTLRGVRAVGYHGVLELERREGQEFVVDVELGLDTCLLYTSPSPRD